MKLMHFFTDSIVLFYKKQSKLTFFIKLFPVLTLLFSCNKIVTTGNYKINYSEDNKTFKSIKTFSDGIVFIKDSQNENTIKIFPNTVVEKINDQYDLKEGVCLIIDKHNYNYKKINIEDNIYFDNELGKCQFYRIKLPKYFNFSSSNINIQYHLNTGIKNINTKLQQIKTFDNENNYYGFFIPLVSNWDFDYYSIYIELFNNDKIIFKSYKNYKIMKKEFEVQRVFFNYRKSKEIAKYDQKRYKDEKEIRDNIYIENNQCLFTANGYYYPIFDIQYITSEFNLSRELRLSNGRLFSKTAPHSGLDYAQPKGTNVFAASDGVVRYANYDELFGKTIVIEHGLALYTVYSHLDAMIVKVGDLVKKGDLIGKVGDTGTATGPHLHWEARVYGIPVDPRSFISLEQIFMP